MIDPFRLFSPKLAITSANREYFAGRRDDFVHALQALAVPGSAYALAGEGGIGKTSLALQLKDILEGETKLLDSLDIRKRLAVTPARYRCAWLKVTNAISDVDTLLSALLRDSDDPFSLYQTCPKAFQPTTGQAEEITREYEGGIPGLGKAKAQFKSNVNRPDEDRRDVVSQAPLKTRIQYEFQDLLARIRKTYKEDLIIFIDDFQRLAKRDGIGDLIKDTDNARFFIVGVADDIQELLNSEPPGRKLEASSRVLKPMTRPEVDELLNRAEDKAGSAFKFDQDYRQRIVEFSEGYPWLVQLIGFHSVTPLARTASKGEPVVLNASHARRAVMSVASTDGDDERYGRLVKGVGSSLNRQKILFTLADMPYQWIEKKALRTALEERAKKEGNEAPKALDQHLQQLVDAQVIRRNRDGHVRFLEPLLRAIARFARERGSVAPSS